MTIRKGEPWGALVVPEPGMLTVTTDAQLAALVTGGADAAPGPVGLLGGDLMRTVGGQGDPNRFDGTSEVPHLPIDIVRLTVDDDRTGLFVANLVARRSWWRGPIVAAMNAQFLGTWDVAPRSHPNDGRVDVVTVAADLSLQQRWLARSRLKLGTHVPHPAIRIAQHREITLDLGRSTPLWLDGQRWGSGRRVHLTVVPDAAVVCV